MYSVLKLGAHCERENQHSGFEQRSVFTYRSTNFIELIMKKNLDMNVWISALHKGLMLRSSRYYIRSVYGSRSLICVSCKKKNCFKISNTTWYHNKTSTYKPLHIIFVILWLTSLRMIISRSTHAIANGIISFFVAE